MAFLALEDDSPERLIADALIQQGEEMRHRNNRELAEAIADRVLEGG